MKPIQIPDNQNRFVGGYCTVIPINSKIDKGLVKLSSLSIWDLIDSGNVLCISSLGWQDASNKERKFIDIGISGDGKRILYTENVMGFLSVDGVEISVYSRFDECGHKDKKEPKDYFLFHMLSKVCGVSMAKLMASTSRESVLDLYPLFFPKMLKDAVHQGLFRSYRQHKYNDIRIKGRIDMARHIQRNLLFSGNVAYSAREYDGDNLVTQLIRHTIEYLRTQPRGKQALACDPDTKAAVELIIQATPTYDHRQFLSILQKNISKKVTHPFYYKYIILQKLCIAILQHKKASYGGNGKQHIQGILFDGAWLWEEYMASVLKDSFRHYTDKNSHFSLFSETNQRIIPDYISNDFDESKDVANAVADAKYMRLEDRLKLQGEQAYSVYYKTIMYMHRFNSQKGFIFYPMEPDVEGTGHDIKTLSIAGTDSKIYMCGFRIPQVQDKDFAAFRTSTEKEETKFKEAVSQCLINHKSCPKN